MVSGMDADTRARLDRESYISLGTWRRNGKVVDTPVWCAGDGERFYVFSEGDAGKVKRLRNGPRVRVAPCSVRGRVTGDWIEGQGRIVTDPARIEHAYQALRRKYGWQMRLADFFSKLAGRYDKRAVIELEL
jgi:uncharacterized protein